MMTCWSCVRRPANEILPASLWGLRHACSPRSSPTSMAVSRPGYRKNDPPPMKAAELETHPATSQPVVGTESLQTLPRVLGGVMPAVASTPGGEDADAVRASSQQHVHQMDQRLALPWRRQIRLMDVSLRSIREPHGADAPPAPPPAHSEESGSPAELHGPSPTAGRGHQGRRVPKLRVRPAIPGGRQPPCLLTPPAVLETTRTTHG